MGSLPTPGAFGQGAVLNDYLSEEHESDGTHKTKKVFVNVRDYGAVSGGSSAVNKAAFIAAIAVLVASVNGGTLYVPAGVYNVGDLSVVLPQSTGKSYHIRGDGKWATFIDRTIDSSSGQRFISAPSGGSIFSTIEKISLRGPGTWGAVPGGSSWGPSSTGVAVMDGVETHAGMILKDVYLSGWRSAIVHTGDHINYYNIEAHNNYYGMYFSGMTTGDDILIVNFDGTSNAMASVAVATGANNIISSTTFLRGHLGFCPYGVYLETCPTDQKKMQDVHFLGTGWEGLGNGAIYSEGKKAATYTVTFDGVSRFSINNALYGIPSTRAVSGPNVGRCDYMFHASRGNSWTFRQATMTGFGYTPIVAYFDFDYIEGPMKWDGSWSGPFGAAVSGGFSFITCPIPVGGVFLGELGGGLGSTWMGLEGGRAYSFTGTIAASDLVELSGGVSGTWATVKRNTGNKRPRGVAMNAPLNSADLVIVVPSADNAVINTTAGSVGATDVLCPDASTPHKVTNYALGSVPANRPIVGSVNSTTITSGTLNGSVQVTG